ncbi:MAG: DUF72 domain-containing protein [Nannocystaceae bacterium]
MPEALPQLDMFSQGPPGVAPRPPGPEPVAVAAVPAKLSEWAAVLPSGLHLGTSSWSFPGWAGLVYGRKYSRERLARDGLAAYAQHPLFRTVGLDRGYYAPLTVDDYIRYCDVLPSGFRMLIKAHEHCTLPRFPAHPRYGTRRGRVNDRFLNPAYAQSAVVEPALLGLGEHLGPILFQFTPTDVDLFGGAQRFAERLHRFFAAMPRGPIYAVELRNTRLLTREYAAALRDTGVCHCINVYPGMPFPKDQALIGRTEEAPATVIRWMLHDGLAYEQARAAYDPFDRIVDDDPNTRRELAGLIHQAARARQPTFVIVNNKAEGSSPLSVARLAGVIAAGESLRASS